MHKDTHNIFESYKKVHTDLVSNEGVIKEGLFDRIKARGAQAVGAVKGAGQQVAGKAQQFAGKAVGKASKALGGGPEGDAMAQNIQKSGEQREFGGKMAGDVAKYTSYIKSAVATTVSDLKSLNMPIKDENALSTELKDVIVKHLKNVHKGQIRAKPGTKFGGKFGGKVT